MATLALAASGMVVFLVLDLPLPFLFGPMFACLGAALFGARLLGPGALAVAARTILGVAIGATVTPELLHQLPAMLASVAFIPLYVVVIGLIGIPFFRICRFDRIIAYYAAMPGGLQDMVILGTETGATGAYRHQRCPVGRAAPAPARLSRRFARTCLRSLPVAG